MTRLRADSLERKLLRHVDAAARSCGEDIGWCTNAPGFGVEFDFYPLVRHHSLQTISQLTTAVSASLLQEEDAGALQGQKYAFVAVDILLLQGLGCAVGVGVGLD